MATTKRIDSISASSYSQPTPRAWIERFIKRKFARNKYDYRDLWMQFSDQTSGGPLSLNELLPQVGVFIANAMLVQQVAIWLSADTSRELILAYHHEPIASASPSSLAIRLRKEWKPAAAPVEAYSAGEESQENPIEDHLVFHKLGVHRFVIVRNGEMLLGVLGVGANADEMATKEETQLLAIMSNQLAHLIINQRLSEEWLLAREWESFNRFSSFILHDLKNLATLQSMTLENAKTRTDDPKFIADVISTFGRTTEKMINLIASLSVRRDQLSLKQEPLNILVVIRDALEEIKIENRTGLKVTTNFPHQLPAPIIMGDPELLQKAFTNILLNAVQSLPKEAGSIEITVTNSKDGKATAEITDTGCGIPPEQLQKLFRPFQTTKRQGMGVGLCHTRSIVEFHGGNIHLESAINTGTRVRIELPTLANITKGKK